MTEPRAKTRAQATLLLDEHVSCVPYVTPARVRSLERLGITRVRDLLTHYPYRYNDMTRVTPIARAPLGEKSSVVAVVDGVKVKKPRPRLQIIELDVRDESGVAIVTFFNQPWLARALSKGATVFFYGKVTFDYGFRRMDNPEFTVLTSGEDEGLDERKLTEAMAILPVHRATDKLSARWVARLVREALGATEGLLDPLPPDLRIRYRLMNKGAALRAMHYPADMDQRALARRRLAYEEVLLLQLSLMMQNAARSRDAEAIMHVVDGSLRAALTAALPFELTADQRSAVEQIASDMAAPVPMNRLLIGDVGSGKTAVAAFALAFAADTGCQAAMMAPTEVLAMQYGKKLGPLFDACGITWACLTSSTTAAERAAIVEGLTTGAIRVAFGTHALLEDDVRFSALSLVIIDEQHRFGVDQRRRLCDKRPGCDVLSMTATPIPRSLALTLYGGLSCSYLHARPTSAAGSTTTVLPYRKRGEAYDAIRAAVDAGHQAYIICPLVSMESGRKKRDRGDDDEAARMNLVEGEGGNQSYFYITEFSDPDSYEDVRAAERELEILSSQVFPQYRVGLLTGQLASKEKRAVMERFAAGEIDVLVCTTVVEVGVDVPNATVMMVENADRFGLTQLHQLRGRVGRGAYRGEVYLMAQPTTEEGKARLNALDTIDDGFELAEYDLSLRKEGDILGSRQHGISALKLTNVVRDIKLIECAHRDAQALLADDPQLVDPRNALLRHEMEAVFGPVVEPGEGERR